MHGVSLIACGVIAVLTLKGYLLGPHDHGINTSRSYSIVMLSLQGTAKVLVGSHPLCHTAMICPMALEIVHCRTRESYGWAASWTFRREDRLFQCHPNYLVRLGVILDSVLRAFLGNSAIDLMIIWRSSLSNQGLWRIGYCRMWKLTSP